MRKFYFYAIPLAVVITVNSILGYSNKYNINEKLERNFSQVLHEKYTKLLDELTVQNVETFYNNYDLYRANIETYFPDMAEEIALYKTVLLNAARNPSISNYEEFFALCKTNTPQYINSDNFASSFDFMNYIMQKSGVEYFDETGNYHVKYQYIEDRQHISYTYEHCYHYYFYDNFNDVDHTLESYAVDIYYYDSTLSGIRDQLKEKLVANYNPRVVGSYTVSFHAGEKDYKINFNQKE